MLYYLSELFNINLFHYITFRAGVAFFVGFVMTLFLMPKFIKWAKSTNSSQPIYELAPDSHKQKSKTPTMGGVIFVFSTVVATIFSANMSDYYILSSLFLIIFISLVGFVDDRAKILQNKNEAGLKPKTKLLLQISIASIAVFLLIYNGFSTTLYVPFYKHPLVDMNYFAFGFWVFIIVGASNAVNLTDGLDGLATMPSFLALLTFGVISYIVGNAILSNYLFLPNIAISEIVIITTAFAGSLLGFLWFNAHPAEVFMGDSGSLTIGAFLGYVSIVSKSEVLLVLVGIIFVIETFSVIIQVYSYKTRKKRVFLMAPIHHHFEKKGWMENKIIVRFWIVSIMANLLALISLKVR